MGSSMHIRQGFKLSQCTLALLYQTECSNFYLSNTTFLYYCTAPASKFCFIDYWYQDTQQYTHYDATYKEAARIHTMPRILIRMLANWHFKPSHRCLLQSKRANNPPRMAYPCIQLTMKKTYVALFRAQLAQYINYKRWHPFLFKKVVHSFTTGSHLPSSSTQGSNICKCIGKQNQPRIQECNYIAMWPDFGKQTIYAKG